mgnify:CR=1 FL=1
MSIAKRQKVLLDSGLLEQLGFSDVIPVLQTQLEKDLNRYGTELIARLKEQLEKDKTTASKDLLQSINYYTKQQGISLMRFHIMAAEHWQFVNDGRGAGKAPPIENIIDWIASKGIKVRTSRAQSGVSVRTKARSMAFAISKKIAQKGTIKRFGYNGTGFLTNEVNDQSLKDLSIFLTETTGQLIQLSFKKNFN